MGLNGLMLMATPAYGSHYVVDVIAGTLIAMACWIVAARIVEVETGIEHLTAIPYPPSIVPETLPQEVVPQLSRKLESV